MDYYQRALELAEETVAHRRFFHENAEVGLELPKARAYVMETLAGYGLEPKVCGHGVTATLGSGGKCILLRADMDALPMAEESGEPFACPSGTAAHACGHDLHAAMLLTAAKMLKEREGELTGTVKFMFQTAEETFQGARDMVENGILRDPPVDAALAFHVTAGKMPVGIYMYNSTGALMASVDDFRITLRGKGGHGAYPNKAIDPINIGVHVYLALQALIAREADPEKMSVLTLGSFQAGSTTNIIPETAVLQGTLRTKDPASRELLTERIRQVTEGTAQVYGGTAQVEMLSQVPPLICDPKLTREVAEYIGQMGIPCARPYAGVTANASEDFAAIAQQVPGAFVYLSAGFPEAPESYMPHNSRVRFNEAVCPMGAACYAHCAHQWLKAH